MSRGSWESSVEDTPVSRGSWESSVEDISASLCSWNSSMVRMQLNEECSYSEFLVFVTGCSVMGLLGMLDAFQTVREVPMYC